MKTHKIQWINQNPGASRDEQGYWTSFEGRFDISPKYNHSVNPSSFEIIDMMGERAYLDNRSVWKPLSHTFDTISECKLWAINRICQ
jgi:hypothetical protein